MSLRLAGVGLLLVVFCSVAHGKEDRWSSFAEDSDQKYYLDKKSVFPVGDYGFSFWIRSVPKDKEYIRREYNMTDLSYLLTNYELNCSEATFRVREILMFDKNRKELAKNLPEGEAVYEPIQPESIIEMAQESFCGKGEGEKRKVSDTAPEAQPAAQSSTQPAVTPQEPGLQ